MTTCCFPQCKNEANGKGARAAFCEEHVKAKCKFSEVGRCTFLTMPNSGFCKKHNDEVVRFDFIHAIRHNQANQQMIAQQQMEAVRQKMSGGNGQGTGPGGLHIIGGH